MSSLSYKDIKAEDIVFGEVGHTNVNNQQYVSMSHGANGKVAFWLTTDKTKPCKNLFGLKPPYGVEDQIRNAQATGQKEVVENLMKKDDVICLDQSNDQEDFIQKLDERVKRVAVKNFNEWFPSKANAKGYEKEEKRKEYVEENYISRLSKFRDSMDKSGKDVAKFSSKEEYMAFRKRKYNIVEEDLPEEEKKRFLRVSVPKGKNGTAFEVVDWDQSKEKFKGKPRPATCIEDKPSKEGGNDHVLAFVEIKKPNSIWFGSMGFGLNLVMRSCCTVKGMSSSSVSAGDVFGFESESEDEDAKPASKRQKPAEPEAQEWDGDLVHDPNSFDPGNL